MLLLASLLLREYYSFYLSSDIAAQLQTLGNFMHGHGISFTGTDKTGQLEYYKFSLWPAGFVIFLVPFYLGTKSVVVSAILLKPVAYIFFVVFIARCLKLLQVSTPKKKPVVLFLCISIAPFIHFFPSDLLATVFCLWGFYYNLKYQESEIFFYLISYNEAENISHFLLSLKLFAIVHGFKVIIVNDGSTGNTGIATME